MRRSHWLALAVLVSCSKSESEREPFRVLIRAHSDGDIDLERIEWPASVRSVTRVPRGLVMEVDRPKTESQLTLTGAGLCPTPVTLSPDAQGAEVEVRALLVASAGNAMELGFDQPFSITLTPGCREGLTGKVEWSQIEGVPLEFSAEQSGYVLRGRTRPFVDVHPAPAPHGIVPISPRTRGSYVFRARFTGGGGATTDVTVPLASAARSAGLPSIALGVRVYLGGSGWHVKVPAREGRAEVERGGPLESFRPDVRGRWLLEDANGGKLAVVAGLHSETPLDCGRTECHPNETAAAQKTPMFSVFRRGVSGELGFDSACAMACHTAGEPGIADGGFDALRRTLGLASRIAVGPDGWDALPRPLRRTGGVTCTACHGPGAIPEPSARWAVLRADVCAVCHDAPPRYGHVAAWAESRMARSDADTDARQRSECRGCHTTSGFLERHGLRKADPLARDVPVGISCAACHAPHAEKHGKRLLREVAVPKGVTLPAKAAESRVCVSCHASDAGSPVNASAATLVFGSAPGTPAPHAELGCMGCHGAGQPRGESHRFAPVLGVCASCHEGGVPVKPDLRTRALALHQKLTGKAPGSKPAHALGAPLDPPAGRALADVLLVLEDPAAGVHNAAYARALLDEAERLIERGER